MTVGMQGSILDKLSDDFATALYDSLFQGFTFGEALQQARQNIAQSFDNVGLPVGYVSANGWSEAFSVDAGTPSVGGLGKPGEVALGGEIQPPRPLLGRNLELHQIAKLYSQGHRVITVAGTGGMGKTALASAFAERFAWMWSRGVRAYSFANEVNAANFRYALMRALFGAEQAQQSAGLSEAQQREVILNAAREWNGLWLFDNYESVLDEKDKNADSESIHRLIYDLANGGAALLLTSRNQPADLPNELLYPEGSHALRGLGDEAGVALFFQHSAKAKENAEAHLQFAFDIQRAAEGHPLAIALLAGEYDVSAVTMDAFLQGWQGELTNARRSGLAGHHITFTTAFERSYSHLSPDLKLALTCLSIFPFPFFAQGFSVVIGELPSSDGGPKTEDGQPSTVLGLSLSSAKQTLDELTRRSLLEVEGRFPDNTPATYRFQPALRQEAAHRLDSTLITTQQNGYAAYGAWLAILGYAKFESDIPVNRLVLLSMDAMENATETLQGAERLWHIRRLAWLKNAWGETRLAFDLLNSSISETLPDVESDPESAKVESSLRFELAGIYVTRGDLDRALSLYQESIALREQLGDKRETAAILHAMASIFITRGNFDRALELYEENLKLNEQLGDKKGKAASLHQMAQVYLTRGDLDRALRLYEESLTIKEQLGDKKGKAASLSNMAQVYLTRGDLDRALRLYEESLALNEQLGDKKGKAISLSMMSNVFWEKKDYGQAQYFVEQSIEISRQLGDLQAVAYNVLKLGQLSQVLGDKTTALARFQESLNLFERLGAQPMIEDVRQMIAELEGGVVANDDPLAQIIAQARTSAGRGDAQSAIQYQEQAVGLAREMNDEQILFIQMVNLAQFYAMGERFDDSLSLLDESLKMGEAMKHPELNAVRQMQESIQRLASMSPEERAQLQNSQASNPASGAGEGNDFESQLQAQLAQLPPEERPQAEAQIRKAFEDFQRMSPEEQAKVLQAAQAAEEANRLKKIDNAADQVRDAGLAYFRKQAPKRDVLQMLEGASKNMKDGESAGSPWLEVAALCDALIALIQEESIPPVPAAYASHFSAVQSEMKKE